MFDRDFCINSVNSYAKCLCLRVVGINEDNGSGELPSLDSLVHPVFHPHFPGCLFNHSADVHQDEQVQGKQRGHSRGVVDGGGLGIVLGKEFSNNGFFIMKGKE